ncbi:hypothetical protein BASA81_006885 [Batrachochytrium salamandrivorans]|nr:hypothetical protein BASA81_006885 [Batrachochytrium salamandrivorans]
MKKKPTVGLDELVAMLASSTTESPRSNLLLKSGTKFILTIPNVLSERECLRIVKWAELEGFVQVSHEATKDVAFRDNGRLQIQSPALASALWPRFQPHVPANKGGLLAGGLNPNFRFYKYETGQRFGPHVDESQPVESDGGAVTLFTVLVYLNDRGLVGGETVFYPSHPKQVHEVRNSSTSTTS